jgi:hypothetical protein
MNFSDKQVIFHFLFRYWMLVPSQGKQAIFLVILNLGHIRALC